MRFPFLPRPSRAVLASQPLQVIVRDYPETLASLREHGMSPGEYGDRSLNEFDEFDDPEILLDALEGATAWRPGVSTA